MNENIQHEFFIWEEKNSTDLNQNLLKNAKQDKCVTTIGTNQNVENLHWKDITDVKLRMKMYQKNYREINKDKLKDYNKKYQTSNSLQIKLTKKNWYKANEDKMKEYKKNYVKINETRVKETKKIWRENNKQKIREQSILYKDTRNKKRRNRMKYDIEYKLSERLRSRLHDALNGNYKTGSTVKDLGCTVSELKVYLESKFKSGMSWDNYGYYGWHIDHIKPLASFDLTDRQQFLEACHYTNLQPLWAIDNIKKKDRIL